MLYERIPIKSKKILEQTLYSLISRIDPKKMTKNPKNNVYTETFYKVSLVNKDFLSISVLR